MQQDVRVYHQRFELERFVAVEQLDQVSVHRFAKGERICDLEQPVKHLYFFVEGRANVVLPTENGRQLLLCFYEPLQLFGDLEICQGQPRAAATVEALVPCVCLGLQRAFVVERMASDPLFTQQLCASLARKLERAIRNSALNMLHPLENRLASYILATAAPDDQHELVFAPHLTHTADALGTSFRHLHRTLGALCAQGVLRKHHTTYVVQQMDVLEQRAAGVYAMT